MVNSIIDNVSDACRRRKRITLQLKGDGALREVMIERIYDNKIIKFISLMPGCAKNVTGFLLLSDICDVVS